MIEKKCIGINLVYIKTDLIIGESPYYLSPFFI